MLVSVRRPLLLQQRRSLSVSLPRPRLAPHKKHRIEPTRRILVNQDKPTQKTNDQLEADDITRQLRQQAGHSLKTRFKGVKVQAQYFESQIRRQDKEILTREALEGLPDLTEAEIDDFYVNLLASGTTLGNLPEVPSPTHLPFKASSPAIVMTADEFAELSRVEKERVVEERLRVLNALGMRKNRRRHLMTSLGVPEDVVDQQLGESQMQSMAAPEDVAQAKEVDYEQVRVEQSQEARAQLELNEDGESRPVDASTAAPASTNPKWTSSSPALRSKLAPRLADEGCYSSDEAPSPSSSTSTPSNTPAAVSVDEGPPTSSLSFLSSPLDHLLQPPTAYHDPSRGALSPSELQIADIGRQRLADVLVVPSSTVDLLFALKTSVDQALQGRSDRRASPIDLGLITAHEWKEVVDSLLTTDLVPATTPPPTGLRKTMKSLAHKRDLRRRQLEKGKMLPLSQTERGRLIILQERGNRALEALETCWRSGAEVEDEWVESLGAFMAEGGNIEGLDSLIEFVEEKLRTEVSTTLHGRKVLAHLSLVDIPSALATLHELEDRSIFVPESTYRALIYPLAQSPAPSHRATGWNLFGHMRLVAHPSPSLPLYTDMISACAHPTHPEPERALDLWHEMTIDSSIVPDIKAFNAVILSCGQVSRFYPQAFLVMRQLLDAYQTALEGTPQKAMYTPNRETFEALLDGARRNGDVARARWVLTEMIRFSNHPGLADDGRDVGPTARTLQLVLDTYAKAQPLIQKNMLKSTSADEKAGEAQAPSVEGEKGEEGVKGFTHEEMANSMKTLGFTAEAEGGDGVLEGVPATELDPTFSGPTTSSSTSSSANAEPETSPADPSLPPRNVATSPVPQSAAEFLQEATLLFHHAIHDSQVYVSSPDNRSPSGGLPPLRFVKLNPNTINSYLAVHYAHDTLSNSVEKFKSIFAQLDRTPNGQSWRFVFEFLGRASGQRDLASIEAFELFKGWEKFETMAKTKFAKLMERESPEVASAWYESAGYTPVVIQRVFAAMIKIMSTSDQLDLARSLLERFVELYPPSDILKALPPLLPAKTLVSLIPRVAVRPDPLPPHLLFPDIQPLHHRYVTYEQQTGIDRCRFITASYERALSQYRQELLNRGKEGEVRQKEVALDQEQSAHFRERVGPPKPIKRHLKSRFKTLEDFEGVMGDIPEGGGKVGSDKKRGRIHGKKSVEMYHRALLQKWE